MLTSIWSSQPSLILSQFSHGAPLHLNTQPPYSCSNRTRSPILSTTFLRSSYFAKPKLTWRLGSRRSLFPQENCEHLGDFQIGEPELFQGELWPPKVVVQIELSKTELGRSNTNLYRLPTRIRWTNYTRNSLNSIL